MTKPLAKLIALAAQLLLVMCVLATPVSAKTALGGYQLNYEVALGGMAAKSLNVLDIFLDYKTAALGCCNGPDTKLPETNAPVWDEKAGSWRDPATGKFAKAPEFDLSKVDPPKGTSYDGTAHRYEYPDRVDTTWNQHKGNVNADHRYTGEGQGGV